MLSKFLSIMQNVGDDISKRAKQYANARSMGRVASVTAMVAYIPDGDADKEELTKGIKAIQRSSAGVYDLTTMLNEVNRRIETLQFDTDIGEGELMKELDGANGDEGDFLVRVAIAVGKASGEEGEDPFSDAEKAVVARIARKVGQDPANYGL